MSGVVRTRRNRRTSSPWFLLYLVLLAFQPLGDPAAGPLQWAAVVAVAAVFVPVYLIAESRPGPVRRFSPVIATALGVLVLPVNSYGGVMFVFAAAFAGNHLSRPAALRWLSGLTVLLLAVATMSTVPFPYRFLVFVPSLVFIWVVGLTCAAEACKRRDEAAMHAESARIEHLATLTERERISRDLHDLLGQTLTGIVVRSQLAQRLNRTDPDAGAAEMAEVEQAARAALGEVRATVAGWRHVVLDDELVVAGEALAAAGVELTVTRDPDVVLAPSAESALSLALREAVTNVVRHAHATRCTVALRRAGGQVVLEVADDGVGGGAAEGTGLTGMRERVAALGGQVQRRARGGTSLTVAVPAAVPT